MLDTVNPFLMPSGMIPLYKTMTDEDPTPKRTGSTAKVDEKKLEAKRRREKEEAKSQVVHMLHRLLASIKTGMLSGKGAMVTLQRIGNLIKLHGLSHSSSIKVAVQEVTKAYRMRYKVDNVKELKELYQYLITNVSQRYSYNSLKKFIKINSANTIKKYIDYLEETYFISQVSKFDYSLKKQIINDKKAYFVDNGFISKISMKFTKDNGWLLENLVFTELKNSGEIFYHSDKFECDFVIAENKKVKEAVQVCWNLTQTNREREFNGLLEAMDKFKLKTGLILTNDQEEEIEVDKNKIIVKPVWKWLLSN